MVMPLTPIFIEGVFDLVEFKGFNNGFNFIDHALLFPTVRADRTNQIF